MDTFNTFLETIDNDKHKATLSEVLNWIADTFPNLETTIKWNQPMFTDHGTFIIGFSVAKQHFSIAPEAKALNEYAQQIEAAGYSQTNNLFRIKWSQDIDYALLKAIIQYNIEDKSNCDTFWRP
ncbi:iron chaperone [Staphylococcus saprophyticus]|uniref:iron chaperone n=1 Tax=Staphylococcus saprophyticus TaxID=29385 RepID=UPI0008537C78|nr:iron chaperone [Staphylococcus saprophyticus]MCE5130748.1 iron chaperone [Staphylococcus saprophyticus]MDW3940311.1 iron chaperone [Staphylococcus saprophyticus]MDW4213651.1 iron chaperone [Staphylococcus saprophyticus]MDW4228779.1 iron chaperone [Staphylococcus saprophyticus]MDW4282896.1 iron chaperone [Staphylococcus saprophyticus]